MEEYFFLANKVLQCSCQPSDSGETVRVAFQQLGDHCRLNMSCLMLLRECMSSQGQSNDCQGLDPSSTVKKLRDIHENISIDDILERESRIIKYHEMYNYVYIDI